MDHIKVVDLEVFAYHGVLQEEKENGQTFLVSFDAYFDLSVCAASDDLNLSVSYAEMCHTVKEYMTSRVHDLIETVAEGIAKELLTTYDLIDHVKVILKKPSAPIGEPVAYPAIVIERGWHQVYIGMGSNMGDRYDILKQAIETIAKHRFIDVVKESGLVETEPWGKTDQPSFVNGALELRTLLNPRELMTYLLEVEQHFDRKRDEKWGPRTLDLDIILYDDLVSEDPYVVIPHPLMEHRAFVLEPLCDIAPFKVHPLLNKRIIQLLELLE